MSEKATPRPWEWDSGIIPPDGPETYSDIYVDGGDTIIARVNDRIAEGDANARLIVEAVNSYDAAQATIADLNWIINRVAVSPAAIESAREERRRMNLAVTRPDGR